LPYLVMELLEGRPFDKLPLPLPPLTVIRYLKQVASALDRAHAYVRSDGTPNPIVHRDLKPDNLFLVEKEGADPFVKILDFGLAKVLTQTAAHSAEFKGTPLFMAWEQAARKPSSPQTDIWALGLIAFYLLVGDHYWESTRGEGGELAALFAEILALPLDPPSQRIASAKLKVTLPPMFDEWFANCVNRRPESRYATAGEAISDLETVLQGGRISALVNGRSSAIPQLPSSSKNAANQPVQGVSIPAHLSDSHVRSTETPGPAERTLAAASHGRNDGRIVAFGVAALVLACGAGGYALFGPSEPVVVPAVSEPPTAPANVPSLPAAAVSPPVPVPATPSVMPDVATTPTVSVPPAAPAPVSATVVGSTPKRQQKKHSLVGTATPATPAAPPPAAPSTLYGKRKNAGQAPAPNDPLYGKRVH
jgi:serine/threonine protein kinase